MTDEACTRIGLSSGLELVVIDHFDDVRAMADGAEEDDDLTRFTLLGDGPDANGGDIWIRPSAIELAAPELRSDHYPRPRVSAVPGDPVP